MNRRRFLQLSAAGCASMFFPNVSFAAPSSVLDQVVFNQSSYLNNKPRVIMVFLYGGPSELAGNFTNYEDFKDLSQESYSAHFGSGNLEATTNGFWRSAGGTIMEELTASSDLSVLRTCFSQVRDDNNNRSHGSCVGQNQRGSFNENTSGIFATLAEILRRNNIVHEESVMPFLSMEGDSSFFAQGEVALAQFLKPLDINERLDNPYKRSCEPSYGAEMDALAQQINPPGKIKDAFAKRAEMQAFIEELIENSNSNAVYPNNSFARKLKTAIDVMTYNPETLVVSTGSGGLGGWDDHSDAENYITRMNQLFGSLQAASNHLKTADPDGNICIMVMGDFGRGVNLNGANGWDHGNLQSFYVLGGKKYFNFLGPYGETRVDYDGNANRLFLKPATSSYWFEPIAIAATIYSIFGITNPQILTDNIGPIDHLLA